MKNCQHRPCWFLTFKSIFRIFSKRFVIVIFFNRTAESCKHSHAQYFPVMINAAPYRFTVFRSYFPRNIMNAFSKFSFKFKFSYSYKNFSFYI